MAAMSKVNFEMIAGIIRETRPDEVDTDFDYGQAVACASLALQFADALQKTSPRFNRARFIEACSIGIGKPGSVTPIEPYLLATGKSAAMKAHAYDSATKFTDLPIVCDRSDLEPIDESGAWEAQEAMQIVLEKSGVKIIAKGNKLIKR